MAYKTDNKMKQLTQEQLEQVYREHPKWTMELKVGKWYHRVGDTNFLMCFQGKIGNYSAYGFNLDGKWSDALGTQEEDQWTPATDEEVEDALIAEAKQRYKNGDKVEEIQGVCIAKSNNMFIREVESAFLSSYGNLWALSTNNYHICLFIRGKWATVITPASTLTEDIQTLKDKYPNYNWTIIAEAK